MCLEGKTIIHFFVFHSALMGGGWFDNEGYGIEKSLIDYIIPEMLHKYLSISNNYKEYKYKFNIDFCPRSYDSEERVHFDYEEDKIVVSISLAIDLNEFYQDLSYGMAKVVAFVLNDCYEVNVEDVQSEIYHTFERLLLYVKQYAVFYETYEI